MKVERVGTTLKASLSSTSRWAFTFDHTCSSECHADLVASVINRHYEELERYRQANLARLNDRVDNLLRSNAALRGAITKLKNRNKKV